MKTSIASLDTSGEGKFQSPTGSGSLPHGLLESCEHQGYMMCTRPEDDTLYAETMASLVANGGWTLCSKKKKGEENRVEVRARTAARFANNASGPNAVWNK